LGVIIDLGQKLVAFVAPVIFAFIGRMISIIGETIATIVRTRSVLSVFLLGGGFGFWKASFAEVERIIGR